MDQPSIGSQPCQTESVFLNLEQIEHGKPFLLMSYCAQAISHGGLEAECIWLCMPNGRKWIAKDIKFDTENPTLGIEQLRKQYGWLKRRSLFSAVGVKGVLIRFLGFREASNDFEVVLIDLDSTGTPRKIERELDAMDAIVEIGECSVDIMGRSHNPNIRCPNEDFDQYTNEIFCKVQNVRRLEQLEVESKWLQPMLEFYWQNGIGTKGAELLRTAGFLVSYKSLQYDQFYDAANPYGKTIRAFKIVEGWRLRYLLLLVVGSLACSICVVAIITVARQSLEDGLTAGSYSLALATTCLAVLAFLSAVL